LGGDSDGSKGGRRSQKGQQKEEDAWIEGCEHCGEEKEKSEFNATMESLVRTGARGKRDLRTKKNAEPSPDRRPSGRGGPIALNLGEDTRIKSQLERGEVPEIGKNDRKLAATREKKRKERIQKKRKKRQMTLRECHGGRA